MVEKQVQPKQAYALSSSFDSLDPDTNIERQCNILAERFSLTNRECDVICLFAQGYSATWIANHFVVSETTVRSHIQKAYKKLNVHFYRLIAQRYRTLVLTVNSL
jgi:ATP/maltotriose-dependent transcriptional regulator MalT